MLKVMIPRPDTQYLLFWILKKIILKSKRKADDDDILMEDVGTNCKKSKIVESCDLEPSWQVELREANSANINENPKLELSRVNQSHDS